ncbi:hypothetical protein M0R45_023993 [Rubus argutus]|uniref:Cytochrome P450 71A1 n=1 Tax=Rubus argutus TaxID=59490 RepID=A0AAW1WPR9_RUBAR
MALVPLLNQLVQELQRSTLLNLVLVSLLLFSIFVLFSLSKSGEKLKVPPSPTRLPIIGNLHQLGKLPHRSLQALSQTYGPLMLLHLGQVPTLVVSSADMTKEIMKNHDVVFSGRPKSTAANILFYGSQDIAFSPYGEFWRQVRKICVVELLSLKRVQQFQYAREEEAAELVTRIRKACLVPCMNSSLLETNLKAILQDMFIAGSDSTSSTMEWLMAELGRNPSVMEKVQEEIRRVVGKKARVDVNDITEMNYLKCVIKETLRLHPAAPIVPRETTDDVELGGYHIPAKTSVYLNAFAIQRDPKYWERPDEFLPDRFEGNSVDFKGEDFQFVPFGGGRRGCPGQAFGVASTEYVLANLLYWFDWKLPSGSALAETLDISEVYGITVTKKAPVHLIPVPYSP